MQTRILAIALAGFFASSVQVADAARSGAAVQKPEAPLAAPFSESVMAGDTLYVAGHIGIDTATGKAAADPVTEARLVMDAIKRTVDKAGLTMDDLVSVTVYCTDLDLFDKFNAVYRTYFHGRYPARAFIGVNKLLIGAHFEVAGIAVKQGGLHKP